MKEILLIEISIFTIFYTIDRHFKSKSQTFYALYKRQATQLLQKESYENPGPNGFKVKSYGRMMGSKVNGPEGSAFGPSAFTIVDHSLSHFWSVQYDIFGPFT